MLNSLFSSTIRAEVLTLLLNSPDEKFYIRQIAKMLQKNPSGIKRELDKLLEAGIIKSEKIANLRYFQANKTSTLFSELKDLIAKSQGLIGSLKNLFRSNAVKTAFVYGAYAEDESSPTVDLLIVGLSSPALLMGLQDIERKFNKRLNCTIIDEADYKVRKKKDASLKKIFTEKRITIIGRA